MVCGLFLSGFEEVVVPCVLRLSVPESKEGGENRIIVPIPLTALPRTRAHGKDQRGVGGKGASTEGRASGVSFFGGNSPSMYAHEAEGRETETIGKAHVGSDVARTDGADMWVGRVILRVWPTHRPASTNEKAGSALRPKYEDPSPLLWWWPGTLG
jgi:hypothetical protein